MNVQRKMNEVAFKTDLTDEQIRNFYKDNLPYLMPDSKHRQYKIVLRGGKMVVLNELIKTPEQLQKLCLDFLPVSVFQTISTWLDPREISGKRPTQTGRKGYKWLNSKILSCDFILDLDKEHCTPVNLSAIEKLVKYDTKVRTGSGYHYWIFHPFPLLNSNPFFREDECRYLLTGYANAMKTLGIQFDYPVSIDPRRIVRTPNTLHQSGKVITIEYSSAHKLVPPQGCKLMGGSEPGEFVEKDNSLGNETMPSQRGPVGKSMEVEACKPPLLPTSPDESTRPHKCLSNNWSEPSGNETIRVTQRLVEKG